MNKRLLARAGLTAVVALFLGASLPLHWPNLVPIFLFSILGFVAMTISIYSLAKSQYHKGKAEVYGENADKLREYADKLRQIKDSYAREHIEKTRGRN